MPCPNLQLHWPQLNFRLRPQRIIQPNPADLCPKIQRRMRQFSTQKRACGRAWRVSTEKWCAFSSEKFCGFFGFVVESEVGVARTSCRSRVKWNSLFLVKPAQRINSGSAEGLWKYWIGSSEKMGVFSWLAPFPVCFFCTLGFVQFRYLTYAPRRFGLFWMNPWVKQSDVVVRAQHPVGCHHADAVIPLKEYNGKISGGNAEEEQWGCWPDKNVFSCLATRNLLLRAVARYADTQASPLHSKEK